MNRIVNVHGNVLVDDAIRHYSQMATPGLRLDDTGSYLIATTLTSSARIEVNGKTFNLGPSSFMRVRGNRSWWDKHTEMARHDLRLVVGRLWARIAKDPREQEVNAVIGVRG